MAPQRVEWSAPLLEQADGVVFPWVVELWTPPVQNRGGTASADRVWTPVCGFLTETWAKRALEDLTDRGPYLTYRVRDIRVTIDLTGSLG